MTPVGRCSSLLATFVCAGVFVVSGLCACIDIRDYEGPWQGPIVAEEAVRQGFSENTRVSLLMLTDVRLQNVEGTLTTDDGKFQAAPLTLFSKATSDVLSSLRFDGDPLRSYLLFAPIDPTKPEATATLVLSFYHDDRAELRIMHQNDRYAIFRLNRP